MEKEGRKKIKLEYDPEVISILIDYLNDTVKRYEIELTNYTCLIETEDISYHFLKHLQKPSVFSISRELKRYMDSSIEMTLPIIKRDNIKYHSVNHFRKDIYKPVAYNIDINAAYPTCLLVNKLIDEQMYTKLMSLNKDERLAAIGMMASRKRRFIIENSNPIDFIENESEYAKYFFFCVHVISEIIWKCEIAAGTSFIFSWVDGLYTTDYKSSVKCREVIERSGYKCTVEKLNDLQVKILDKNVKITFEKNGENKLFNIPIVNNRIDHIIKTIQNEILHHSD